MIADFTRRGWPERPWPTNQVSGRNRVRSTRDTARSWVAEHLARAIALEHDYVGELALSSGSPATGP
jgi:hypothetical protein